MTNILSSTTFILKHLLLAWMLGGSLMWEEVGVPSWRSPYPFKYNHCQWQGFDCSTEIKCIVNYGSLTPIVCYASKLQLCALCLYLPWLIASYYYVTLFWSHKGLFMPPLMDWQIRTFIYMVQIFSQYYSKPVFDPSIFFGQA